ncbi:MAG TPA: CE1759 family FMN reductase [Solirubrobacteraceae bacterium]|nr:CE1759 family FMN reductase [Solirubrobacteraceae bacterium]
MKLVVVSAGVSEPSSTGLLARQLSHRVSARLAEHGVTASATGLELRDLAQEIAAGLVSGLLGPGLQDAVAALAQADGIIAATPVYKAGISGLFKSFADLLDNDLLIAKPVLLAATAGTARHALVVDEGMRSLFTYLRALTVPTGVFASQEDWGDPALGGRMDRAAAELVALMQSGVQDRVRGQSWRSYQHELGSNGGAELEIDVDSEMMRLATGGSALDPLTP